MIYRGPRLVLYKLFNTLCLHMYSMYNEYLCNDLVDFLGFLSALFSTVSGECWDRTQDSCDFGLGLSDARLDLIHM
jgi:hypothetical protein